MARENTSWLYLFHCRLVDKICISTRKSPIVTEEELLTVEGYEELSANGNTLIMGHGRMGLTVHSILDGDLPVAASWAMNHYVPLAKNTIKTIVYIFHAWSVGKPEVLR